MMTFPSSHTLCMQTYKQCSSLSLSCCRCLDHIARAHFSLSLSLSLWFFVCLACFSPDHFSIHGTAGLATALLGWHVPPSLCRQPPWQHHGPVMPSFKRLCLENGIVRLQRQLRQDRWGWRSIAICIVVVVVVVVVSLDCATFVCLCCCPCPDPCRGCYACCDCGCDLLWVCLVPPKRTSFRQPSFLHGALCSACFFRAVPIALPQRSARQISQK